MKAYKQKSRILELFTKRCWWSAQKTFEKISLWKGVRTHSGDQRPKLFSRGFKSACVNICICMYIHMFGCVFLFVLLALICAGKLGKNWKWLTQWKYALKVDYQLGICIFSYVCKFVCVLMYVTLKHFSQLLLYSEKVHSFKLEIYVYICVHICKQESTCLEN